jgi:hypothetical protein
VLVTTKYVDVGGYWWNTSSLATLMLISDQVSRSLSLVYDLRNFSLCRSLPSSLLLVRRPPCLAFQKRLFQAPSCQHIPSSSRPLILSPSHPLPLIPTPSTAPTSRTLFRSSSLILSGMLLVNIPLSSSTPLIFIGSSRAFAPLPLAYSHLLQLNKVGASDMRGQLEVGFMQILQSSKLKALLCHQLIPPSMHGCWHALCPPSSPRKTPKAKLTPPDP